MSDPASPTTAQTAAERRTLGLLQLGLAVVLTTIVVALLLVNRQYWMLAFLVLVIPNVYMGVRELRAARRHIH